MMKVTRLKARRSRQPNNDNSICVDLLDDNANAMRNSQSLTPPDAEQRFYSIDLSVASDESTNGNSSSNHSKSSLPVSRRVSSSQSSKKNSDNATTRLRATMFTRNSDSNVRKAQKKSDTKRRTKNSPRLYDEKLKGFKNEDENSANESMRSRSTESEANANLDSKSKSGRKPSWSRVLAPDGRHEFLYRGHIEEDHGKEIFAVAFNPWLKEPHQYFATVGGSRVTLYRLATEKEISSGRTSMFCQGMIPQYIFQSLDEITIKDIAREDAGLVKESEAFYAVQFAYDRKFKRHLIVCGGKLAVIQLIDMQKKRCVGTLKGHGDNINDLQRHPTQPELILSASADLTCRLWNCSTQVCILKLAGDLGGFRGGHSDQMLTAEFHPFESKIVTGGMDHLVAVWNLPDEAQKWISDSFDRKKICKMQTIPSPQSSELFHENYVDHCRFFRGDLMWTKSCDSEIYLCKFGDASSTKTNDPNDNVLLGSLNVPHSDVWFIRFDFSPLSEKLDYQFLACGNGKGAICVFDVAGTKPVRFDVEPVKLHHNLASKTIRMVTFSPDGRTLIAADAESTIYRWDIVDKNSN